MSEQQNLKAVLPKFQDRLLTWYGAARPAMKQLCDATKQKQIRLVLLYLFPDDCLVYNADNELPTIYLIDDGSGGPDAPPESYPKLLPFLAIKPGIVLYGGEESPRCCTLILDAAMAAGNLLLITADSDRVHRWVKFLEDQGVDITGSMIDGRDAPDPIAITSAQDGDKQ
jgi:hypothetical protein